MSENAGELQKVLQKIAEENRKKKEQEDRQKRIDIMIEVFSALYDRAATYTTVVISVGYAAFFAVWTFMKDSMSVLEMRIVALSGGVSVLVFIGWEVFTMIYNALNLRAYNAVLGITDSSFETKWAEVVAKEQRHKLKLTRFWVLVLVFTIGPATIGAIALLQSFIRGLF